MEASERPFGALPMSVSPLLPRRWPFLACGLLLAASAQAQDLVVATDRGVWSGPAAGQGAGIAVAAEGDLRAVGDYEGRVHLFDVGTDTPQPIDVLFGPAGSAFGAALDFQGDRMAVGAPWDGPEGSGSVHLFTRDSDGVWQLEQVLVGPGGAAHDRFGAEVLWMEDRLAVGAPGQGGGRVHLFAPVGSMLAVTQVLAASDGAVGDGLGSAIAWHGDLLVLGAPFASATVPHQGAVYTFRDNGGTWLEESKLVAVGATEDSGFGTSVCTDGFFVAIGAPAAINGTIPAGRGYVFVNGISGWTSIGVLGPVLGRPRDFFGSSMGMRPGLIAVGAPGDDTAQGLGTGSISVFAEVNSLWSRQYEAILQPSEPEAWLGAHLDVSGHAFAVSAPGHTNGTGTVWAQSIRTRIDSNSCGPAVDHSGATDARIFAYGSPRLDDGPLGLSIVNLPASTFGVVLVSDGLGNLPGFMGGQGTLCLAQPVGLFVDQVGLGGTAGAFSVEVDWQGLPLFGAAQVGQSYHFQGWFRDQNPQPTTNLTDAVSILLQ